MSADDQPGAAGSGKDGWWRCGGCGRPSGIGTTCLACTLGVGRGEPDAPTERLDLSRLRAGLPGPASAARSMPWPVQLVEVLLRIAALVIAIGLVLALSAGFAALSYASEPTGIALALASSFLVAAGYAAVQITIAVWAIKGLQRGRPTVRLLLTALPLLDVVDLVLDGADTATALGLALHVAVAALLWLPEASQQHFAYPRPRAGLASAI